MKTISFYDTKPYDRDYMLAAAGSQELTWRFHEFRLTAETAATAAGSDAVCVFVNDKLDRDCLQQLAATGVRHAALRCAGTFMRSQRVMMFSKVMPSWVAMSVPMVRQPRMLAVPERCHSVPEAVVRRHPRAKAGGLGPYSGG